MTRIVFFHERFKVDESLRPRAPVPNGHEDDPRTVAAVVRSLRLVIERVSLVAVLVAQVTSPASKQDGISPERHRLPKLQMHVLSHLPIDGGPNPLTRGEALLGTARRPMSLHADGGRLLLQFCLAEQFLDSVLPVLSGQRQAG